MQDPKKSPKIAIWAPSHNFVGLYLCNYSMYRQSEKKLVKQQYLPYMSPQYGELGPLAAEIVSLVWGTPGNFNGFRVLAALLHGTSSGRQPNCGVEQRARHLYSAGGHHVGHWPTFLVSLYFTFHCMLHVRLSYVN